MTSRQAEQAAEVLRQNAPRQTHEVRHACFAAAKVLENDAQGARLAEASQSAGVHARQGA